MAETTLRAYLDELNLLLQQEALEEVIGHCRHILQHFPKNVETYRLLGTALLEKGRHKEAGDVFQRILSALPDDFTSHLGMAAVAEEGGQFPVAIWHLERAFEQQSSNPQLQSELKRLYERRDGRAPDRIQLTHGALVRVYVKGQLYDQAMTELRSALAESPDRVDLMILQAQVLWNSERTVEAAEVALEVLEKLPDSLEANRILASLWLRNGHTAEAAPFVSRLEQLDPFMAWQVVQDGKEVPREAFRLQRLAWDARSAAMLAADVPDWVSAISNVFDAPESVSLASSTNDWAADSSPTLPSSPTQLKKKTNRLDKLRTGEYTAASAPAEPTAEVPDWFSQMPAAEGFAAPSADEVPDWFKDVGAAVTPAAAASPAEMGGVELPDWFDEVVSAPAEAEAPATALPSWIDDDSSGTADSQFPSGFTDLLSGATAPAPAAAGDSGALPDWMTDDSALDNLAAEPAQALDAMSYLPWSKLSLPARHLSQMRASPPPTARWIGCLAWTHRKSPIVQALALLPCSRNLPTPIGSVLCRSQQPIRHFPVGLPSRKSRPHNPLRQCQTGSIVSRRLNVKLPQVWCLASLPHPLKISTGSAICRWIVPV
jgi:tetratricopeptide (TPR) repeat protein